ncbi:DnaJ_domain-containing protein [Hexamita inflata]|uniref:DnaJ domain-containing protein n=1 Tax=Hexamita inflata TaxID=28002 RepID=A0AA86NNU6_9EUKA|nr:DnaJ domain-containing protein [Hexamita inflata]CAI9915520.1 DnaJ domain-containing protein [Hexamita inflata]CAI9923014.1 DnaJ domain-containing protein [Hexamita inflata]
MTGSAYDVLQVPINCDDDELIRKNYKKLALQHHPDRNTDENKVESESKMKQLNWAYDKIKNIQSRQSYNIQNTFEQLNADEQDIYMDAFLEGFGKTMMVGAAVVAAFDIGLLVFKLIKKAKQKKNDKDKKEEE